MSLVSIELAEPKDAEKLVDISRSAFDSDIEHGNPGIGATKSSAYVPLK